MRTAPFNVARTLLVPPGWTASVVSLSGGALLANLVSVVLLVMETVSFHRG